MLTVALYHEAKAATEALVASLTADQLDQTCAACPAWSIQDVLAHHVHVVSAHLDGEIPTTTFTAIVASAERDRALAVAARDAWTDQGVRARRGQSLPQVLAEWDAVMAAMDERGAGAVLDLVVHLDDIAETLARLDLRPSPLRDAVITGWYRAFVLPRLEGIDATVSLLATDTGRRWGAEGAWTIAGTSAELLRTIVSRRTLEEADRRIDWDSTPDRVRAMIPVYGWPS